MRKAVRLALIFVAGLAILAVALPTAFAAGTYSDDDRYVVLARHAEKQEGDDPDLTTAGQARAATLAHVLSKWPVEVVFASQFLRTQATAAPIAARFGLEAEVVDARDVEGLAERLKTATYEVAVVVGHSNTVPALAKALGVVTVPEIPEYQYDDLLVVRLTSDGEAHLLHLKYGAPTPED